MTRAKWLIALVMMTAGSLGGGLAFRSGFKGAVFGGLITGLVVLALMTPAGDRHLKP